MHQEVSRESNVERKIEKCHRMLKRERKEDESHKTMSSEIYKSRC